uniref:Protein kinase domain-containing protein n=1 Tax=Chenopodium quinoa TaxID=63459 RepID=A0A803KMU5_CHEQI
MGQTQTKYKNKRRPKFESREEYFIKNGGILLEKQIALSQGQHKGAGQLKIFSSREIEKVTDNFDPDFILGFTAHSTNYKATFEGRLVAVKTPLGRDPNPELIDLFLTEASTTIVMNHDNMVKLCGGCLETFIPILVRIKWPDRLRVAIDTAYALSYMHNALSKPVVHRDVNSKNILLDESLHGKLSSFGYSVSITPGETPQKWPVEGTPGYIDPEYIETQEVTDKCDVYSFGVFMLELLTRRQPLLMAKGGTDLVDVFVSNVEKNCMINMIDNEVLQQASRDEIQRVAELAFACVAKKGAQRPTMIYIVSELWSIQGRDMK